MITNFTFHLKVFIGALMLLTVGGTFAQPVIKLIGDNPLYMSSDMPYVPLGATAYDTIDGNLTDSIKLFTDVEQGVTGFYTEDYMVTNSRGQISHVSRQVYILNDITPPVIKLNGAETVYIEARRDNSPYNDPGATATDNKMPINLTSSIVVNGTVNTRRAGIYKLRYTVQDVAGMSDTMIRTVIVGDTRPPEWINKTSVRYLEFGKPFVDSVKIEDAYDETIAIHVSYPVTGAVDVNTPGQYDHIYTADPDSSGNRADTLFVSYIVQPKLSLIQQHSSIFKIYPCPASDILNIDLSLSPQDPVYIRLYTADGQLVSIQVVRDTDHASIDLNGLTQGIYVLDIETGGTSYREKFNKQ